MLSEKHFLEANHNKLKSHWYAWQESMIDRVQVLICSHILHWCLNTL